MLTMSPPISTEDSSSEYSIKFILNLSCFVYLLLLFLSLYYLICCLYHGHCVYHPGQHVEEWFDFWSWVNWLTSEVDVCHKVSEFQILFERYAVKLYVLIVYCVMTMLDHLSSLSRSKFLYLKIKVWRTTLIFQLTFLLDVVLLKAKPLALLIFVCY